jgi:hypothetical protein
MSVRVKLNDRSFFQSPMVIGSRLYEDTPNGQPTADTSTDATDNGGANASVNQQPSIPD